MEATVKPDIRTIANWSFALGVLILILGVFALLLPAIAALAATFTLAWLALLIGVLQLIHAYQTRHEKGMVWKVLSGLLNLAVGVLLLIYPLEGVLAITLVLGALIFAVGVAEIILAFRLRPHAGWGWVLAMGILSVLVGILIAIGWPENSFWVLGFYVGISMVSGGIWRIALSLMLRRTADTQPSQSSQTSPAT
jgi:uncharacterized membrane protein HdeD (DUF308 family)